MIESAVFQNAKRLYKVVHIRESKIRDIHKPTVSTIDPRVRICTERAQLVTESYKLTEGKPWILRRAMALDHLLNKMTIYMQDGELIVGNYASSPNAISTFPEFSTRWLVEELDGEFSTAVDDKSRRILKEIHEYWSDKNVEHRFLESVPEHLKKYIGWTGCIMGAWFWPLGVVMPDYSNRAFKLGMRGIISEIDEFRKRLSPRDREYKNKMNFYDAAEICCRAMISFANRYAQLAEKKAASSSGSLREKYERIANICRNVPENPPATFHEALQAFFFYHLVTSQIDWSSVGMGQRFDQLFWPYYSKDKEKGLINYEDAVQLLQHLWIKLDDLGQIGHHVDSMIQVGGTKFQNCTIGGVDENGNDATNELSFAIIDATMKARTLQPALVLRYHNKIDPKIVDKAIDCIATGIGMPAIFNDNAAIPWHYNIAMTHLYPYAGEKFGISPLLLRAIQFIKFSPAIGIFRKIFRAAMMGSIMKKIDNIFYIWPYRISTAGGIAGNILKKFLKITRLFDMEKALRLARDWSSTACVGGGFRGLSLQGLCTIITAGVMNYLKCLEYVLYRGVEISTGEQLGLCTPDPRTFKCFNDFLDSYCKQLRFQVEKIAEIYRVCERIYAEQTPRPLASILMDTPVIYGRDIAHGGDAGYSEIFSMGSVNTADSLAAIKKLVFDEKKVSMDEIVEACRSNWEGFDYLRRLCLAAPKFGNDDDYVDTILEDLYRKITFTVKSVRDHFGKCFSPEATLAGGYFAGGLSCNATPDGRRAGETVSDGQISPMHGMDKNGPTAVLKSVSKVNPNKTFNQLLNQKFLPQFLMGENKKLFADYLRTWASFNNWHIQFNCIDDSILRDAQKHPERHRNLIVRVAGYSAFFTDLTPGLQNDIIRRTAQSLNNNCSCNR